MARQLTKIELNIADKFYASGDSISLLIIYEEPAVQDHFEKYNYDIKYQYDLFMQTSIYRDCRNEKCLNTIEEHVTNGICEEEQEPECQNFEISDLCTKMRNISLSPWWLPDNEKD